MKFTKKNVDKTTNYEGERAYRTSPKTELTLRFLTFLVNEPKFYSSAKKDTEEIKALINKVAKEDPEYLLKLASFARNEMYLRSAPIFALIQSLKYPKAKKYVKNYIPQIVKRADEINELLAYFIEENGQIGAGGNASLPNSLKKGLTDVFNSFSIYSYGKYNRKGNMTFRDALRLIHPKPKNDYYSKIFKQILEDTLPVPDTWETYISVNGSTKENWEYIIPKMPYMATLRNLRNFLKVNVDNETIKYVVSKLTDLEEVKNSKQYPFRFLSAYKELERTEFDPLKTQKLRDAVATAFELSTTNLPKLKGTTFIIADNSGSMDSSLSSRSKMTYREVANTMGALANKMCENAIVSVFGSSFAVAPVSNRDSAMTNLQKINDLGEMVGGNTLAYLAFEYLLKNNIKVDRIFLFSDMQCYTDGWSVGINTLFNQYLKTINPNATLYSWDLTGYNTTQFPESAKNVILLSGWSDKVLEFVNSFERFGETIQKVERYASSKQELDDIDEDE